jgi:hypothetical protein
VVVAVISMYMPEIAAKEREALNKKNF